MAERAENSVENGEITLRANFPFPTVFSKDLYYRHVKNTKACFGKG